MSTVVTAALGLLTVTMLLRHGGTRRVKRRARALHADTGLRLPGRIRAALARALRDADLDVEPEAALGWWTLAVVTATMLGAALSPLTAILGFVAGVVGGPMVVANGRARTARALDDAVPGLLERVAIELRGAGTVHGAVDGAIDRAVDGAIDGPADGDNSGRAVPGLHLEDIRRATDLGATFPDAVRAWAQRLGRDDVRLAASALGLAATVGGRAADAIDGLAASMRERLAALADARAQAAQARLSAIVVGAAPVAFMAFSAVTDPGAIEALVATSFGRICLGVGLALQLLAVWWIRRIVRSEA